MAVFLNYGLAELGRQYNPFKWSQDQQEQTLLASEKSLGVRRKFKLFNDLSYGFHTEEKLDILVDQTRQNSQLTPVYVFLHGGGWDRGRKENACYAAEIILEKGGIFVAVNFAKIEQVPLAEVVRQSQAAVAWVYKNIVNYGGDPDRIYVGGKSSGAHQVGMVLAADWQKYEAPQDLVKGAVLISGTYDLEPLSLTERRTEIGLNEQVVEDLSPLRHIPAPFSGQSCDLILAYAENDSDEIKRQATAFAEKWRMAGFSCAVIEENGVDHFSIREAMGNPHSVLGRAILALVGL